MATRITLIRHGETDWNVSGRWQGQAPVPLNSNGLQQARVTAAYLNAKRIAFDAVYASDLSRAYVTASLIVSEIGGEIIKDRRLREIDLGDWQGLTEIEVRDWDGDNLARVRADTIHAQRPGGESWKQVGERALSLLREVIANYPNHDVMMTSHGGTIRSVLYELGLLDPKAAHIENCSRTILMHSDGQWTLEAFNLTDHLVVPAYDSHRSEQDNFGKT